MNVALRPSPISVRAEKWANTRELRPVTKDLSGRQPVAPSFRIYLFSGPPAQTVADLRTGVSLRVLARGGTQGNVSQYRRPIYDIRP